MHQHNMLGLINEMDQFSLRRFQATSSASTLSTLWQGVLGSIEVTAITAIGADSLYATTYVKLRNIGAATLTDIYCEYCC